jgi:hypothetical protein
MERSANGYPRRRHADGTYDSICPRCFVTVARQMTGAELDSEEQHHICSGMDLTVVRAAKEAVQRDL